MIPEMETAYYEFDIPAVRSRVAYLRSLLGDDIGIAYAIKANTFIVGGMADCVERFEICSPGECRVCDSLGIDPGKTVISGVYKTPAFIEELVQGPAGRIYTVESLTQFELLRGLSEKYSVTLPILIRLTNDSQFGINAAEIEEIIASRDQYPNLDILGIQFFSGTQKTSLKKLAREIRALDELLTQLQEKYGYTARELEYGTGFPVAYFGEELDEQTLITGFAQLLRDMTFRAKITLEIGRSIAACCGKYYTHIVDKKTNKGQNYLLVDGGMHHIVYFGQYMGMKHPVLTLCGREDQPTVDSWNICGSLCSMNDILAKAVPLPEVQIGDTLCFHNTGAYCMTEGISLFLTREIPAVFLIGEDGRRVCVRRPFETSCLNTPMPEA